MKIKKNDKLYYARIMQPVGVYDVCDLKVRTVSDSWFVGVDKHDKHAYLLPFTEINKTIFDDRDKALQIVLEAERNKPKFDDEDEIG